MLSWHHLSSTLFSTLSFVGLISIVVFIHECGHYIVAKMFGVYIESFSIGFGKELFGFNTKSGSRWKFCLFPLGGYVKMRGESSLEEVGSGDLKTQKELDGSFFHKPRYQKFLIVLAGPVFNLISAFFIFFAMFYMLGTFFVKPEVGGVYANSPADIAGLLEGDIIQQVGAQKITSFTDLVIAIKSNVKKSNIPILYKRDGKTQKTKIDLSVVDFKKSNHALGIIATGERVNVKVGFLESVKKASHSFVMSIDLTLSAVGNLISGSGLKEIGGPIRIAKYSADSVKGGIYPTLWFIAMISINLGVMNLLPVPVLDGGHLFQYFIEFAFLRGKSMGVKYQRYASIFGFVIVISLMVFATFNDVKFMIGN